MHSSGVRLWDSTGSYPTSLVYNWKLRHIMLYSSNIIITMYLKCGTFLWCFIGYKWCILYFITAESSTYDSEDDSVSWLGLDVTNGDERLHCTLVLVKLVLNGKVLDHTVLQHHTFFELFEQCTHTKNNKLDSVDELNSYIPLSLLIGVAWMWAFLCDGLSWTPTLCMFDLA